MVKSEQYFAIRPLFTLHFFTHFSLFIIHLSLKDMNSNGENELKTIEKLLQQNRSILREAAETIRLQDVSKYPIFVISQTEIMVGIPLMLRGQLPDDWTINASTLEEFHAKNLIFDEKIDAFRTRFKKNIKDVCVFALLETGSKFLYITT
jgi:hypothetical protein